MEHEDNELLTEDQRNSIVVYVCIVVAILASIVVGGPMAYWM